ncbi:MAG: mannose-1-phosphate guanylyltransferase [Bacteroidales bacterium]|nr:mannose-1-phosphate guanylyltransferase [Bacteroidales bacterium]
MNSNNYCIIMAGGLGSRIWPVSQRDYPKQFLDILGTGETLLQSTVRRYAMVCPIKNIFVVTGESMAARVHEQVPALDPKQILIEPYRRNTAPCVAYAAAAIRTINPNATVVVTPSDHAVFNDERFAASLRQAFEVCERQDWIVTMGVPPTMPNTKYGYIQYSEELAMPGAPDVHSVVAFTEKPSVEMAAKFIATGEFLWNAGIFVWRMPVLERAFRQYLPDVAATFLDVEYTDDFNYWERVYSMCQSISVDYGIMEKADNAHVLKASFGWSDVETWDSLYDTAEHDANGNVVLGGDAMLYNSSNCVVSIPQDTDKTVVLEGLDGYIVAASKDVFMVCRRQSENMVFRFAADMDIRR